MTKSNDLYHQLAKLLHQRDLLKNDKVDSSRSENSQNRLETLDQEIKTIARSLNFESEEVESIAEALKIYHQKYESKPLQGTFSSYRIMPIVFLGFALVFFLLLLPTLPSVFQTLQNVKTFGQIPPELFFSGLLLLIILFNGQMILGSTKKFQITKEGDLYLYIGGQFQQVDFNQFKYIRSYSSVPGKMNMPLPNLIIFSNIGNDFLRHFLVRSFPLFTRSSPSINLEAIKTKDYEGYFDPLIIVKFIKKLASQKGFEIKEIKVGPFRREGWVATFRLP